jgi:tRNA A-37 threonylcarbamoyl transferase component Bud32
MNKGGNMDTDWCQIGEKYIHGLSSCRVHRILEDTTDFYQVEYGDVIFLNNVGYLVRGTESEKAFGLEGEPKPWVKSCIDLVTGERKIVKLTFLEEFSCRIEGLDFTCLRNPQKEARILEKVKGHKGFMQGFSVLDAGGNTVRILDRIAGRSLDNLIQSIPGQHEMYYREHLPDILDHLAIAYDALGDLHRMGEIHGDITPEHIFVETGTGRYRWIDFDYDYRERENAIVRDIFEMGTLLTYVVGKGYLILREIKRHYPETAGRLRPGDMQSVFPSQLANLKMVYPYIHGELNRLLLSFSQGAGIVYQDARMLAADIRHAALDLR